MRRLLLGVSREAEHSPLLATLQDTILDTWYASRQRAVLTMLTMIAQDLRACAAVVFKKIVPPLLGLTGLPKVGNFRPLSPSTSPDFDIIDLALATISFLGAHGPAGEALKQVRPQFEQYLQQQAEYLLQLGGTLITPAVVPLQEENYRCYEKCVKQWYELCYDVQERKQVTEKDRVTCISIHQQLLESAEEVCYPAETHILRMLQHSQSHPDRLWQDYLREQMNTGTYIDYQSCALLWATLFPEQQAQQNLASVLLEHFSDNTKPQRYAQRFLIGLVSGLSHLSYLRNLRQLGYLSHLKNLKNSLYFNQFRNFKDVSRLINFRHLIYFRKYKYFKRFRYFRKSRYFENYISLGYLKRLRDLKNLLYHQENPKYLKNLRCLILIEKITLDIEQRLQSCGETEYVELLIILLGRVLQIQEADETGPGIEQEVQRIVKASLPFAQPESDAWYIVLHIVYYLPARTEREVVYILDLTRNTQDHNIQSACAEALKCSKPVTDEAWAVLEKAKTSSITVVREAVEERLKRRKSGKE